MTTDALKADVREVLRNSGYPIPTTLPSYVARHLVDRGWTRLPNEHEPLVDVGDQSTTEVEAPKVTTAPTSRPSHREFVQDCQEAVDHARDVSITVLTSDEIIHVCAAVATGYDMLGT